MKAVAKLLRWLLILPAAIAIVPAADWLTLTVLELLGVTGGFTWVAVRLLGHFATGAAAILVGAWIAPARKQTIATLLFVLAILGAIEAVAAGGIPLRLILPLAVAFLAGAFLGLRRIRQD